MAPLGHHIGINRNSATQSCSAKKVFSKSKQNPRKTPARKLISYQSHWLERCNLAEKKSPGGIFQRSYPDTELLFITF